MNFLAPAFLTGLAAVAIPVIIHLIHRERRTVVQFPSLMFLERIPYRSVRRQKIRHLLLLLLRCLAVVLLVAAFARPFFEHRRAAAGAAGAKEVVLLLDHSSSMGYGTRWVRARDAAKKVIGGLGATDHVTLVLFANDASVASEPMASRDRVIAAVNAATVSAEATRYVPALKLASQILSASTLPRREVVLVSDYQKTGWANHNEVTLPRGTTITPLDVGAGSAPNVGVAQVTTNRDSSGERDRVTVATRLVNTGSVAKPIAVTLAIGGRDAQTLHVNLPASGAERVAFAPIPVPSGATKGSVRITPDSLAQDDVLNFTIAPDAAVSVLLVEPRASVARPNQSLFLARALAIGDRPAFHVDERRVDELTPRDLDRRALVVLDEVAPPAGAIATSLRALLDGGGGVVIVPGSAAVESWPAEWRSILPAAIGSVVDRTADAGGTLSALDYAHPIFELFNAPRSGDFSTARFYRYRALTPQTGSAVPARFDDGSPALVERAIGTGKLVVWASTLDSYWTNLPLQPVFLPFVHQLAKDVGRYADPRASFTAGEVLDLSRHGELTAPFSTRRTADSSAELTIEAPSGARERVTATGTGHLVTLKEQGFYELRGPTTPAGSGRPIAVNVDPAESDLSHLEPQAIVTAVLPTNDNSVSASDYAAATPHEQEQRQNVWWYLLLGALFVMALETALSNRLSKAAA
jgi:hypothetical protein